METQKQSAKVQYLVALVVSLLGFLYGIMTGWTSSSILLLTSGESPLPSGTITMEEASWVASLKSLGFLIFSPMFGFLANKLGRKWPMLMLTVPSVISWLLIWFAQNIYYIYVARLLHGVLVAGIFSLCQYYFVEISNDDVRGILGAIPIVSGHIGVPIAMALGTYFRYEAIPICAITMSVLFGVTFWFFPETPLFLVKQNKISKAGKSIRFYQNSRDSKMILAKIEQLRHLIGDNESKKSQENTTKWSDIKENPGRRALTVGFVLAALQNLSGSFALLNYTATIFEEAGSFMSSNESALIVGIIQFIGTTIMPFLVERTGRRALYIISTSGSIVGYAVLGIYMMLKTLNYPMVGFTWIPIVSFSFIVLVQSLAISTLLFAVNAEMMPESLREFGVSFCNTIAGLTAFIVLKFMPLLAEIIDFYGTMFFFGAVCVPCLLFIIFYMPETKGKSYEEIMELLQ